MADSPNPNSLAEIALLRTRRDPATPYLLTIGLDEPHDVGTRSYGLVASRAAALATTLRDAGVEPGATVGCYLDNTPSWVVASLAVWWTGGMVAAVGTLLPAVEAVRLFELAGVSVVVALGSAPELPDGYRVLRVDAEGCLLGAPAADESAWEAAWESDGLSLPEPEAPAVAIFTSGTTGRPKGIVHSHLDLAAAGHNVASAYARNTDYRPEPAPPHLPPGVIFNPFGHMAGITRLAFRMWIGRSALLVPKFTVPAAKAVFSRYEMDSLQLTPAMIHMLATTDEPLELRGVKYVTSGTAPLPTATRERFESRYGVPVMQAYGMTETGAVTQERYDDVMAGRRGPGSVGRIGDGIEVKILPLDDDRPEGEGEILVKTPEITDEFIGGDKVPVDDEGWFHTGDVGRLDEHGILYITGRVQEKIIVGGFNVYPAEVEEYLRTSPLVHEAVVVSLPDERLGEIPVAGIVWEGAPDESALVEGLRGELAHYKVPRHLFTLDDVPRTPRDKVDRARAAELAREALGVSAQDEG